MVRQRNLAPVALVVSAFAMALVIGLDARLGNALTVALVLLGCCAFVAMTIAERRRPALTIKLVAGVVAAETAVSLLVAPAATGDLWWYALYGRIVAVHHASPYTNVPAHFPHDPLLALAGHGWAHVPSVYGPLFTGVSAMGSLVLGTGEVPTRLFYQALAAAALAAACVMIWRRTRSAGAVAFLALNPVVALYLVNGGRNDILVGITLLAAVTFAARGRDTAAGIAAGIGVLIKLTGLVGLVALVSSTASARWKRPATRVALASAGVLTAGYAIAGVHALFTPLQTAGARFSAGSLWRLLPRVGLRLPSPHLALAVLAVIVALVIARTARAGSAACVTAALAALTAGAAYTLAGYAGWALPTAALDHEGRVARLAAAEAVLLVAVYEVIRHPFAGWIGETLMTLAEYGAPLAMLGILVLVVRGARLPSGSAPPTEPVSPPASTPATT